ncbi:MAG: PAS domain S-box protein [Bacteroidia bacterium]|nr:PAS domain S-box protein [Bacteroidia bacterium]
MKRFLVYLIIFFVTCISRSQDVLQNYSLKEGLSEVQVLDICQDSSGYLYIGTNGGGLNIYDGKEFRYITTGEGLSGNVVYAVELGFHGEILVGTDNDDLSNTIIYDIFIDSKDNVWIATFGSGVFCLKDNKLIHYNTDNGLLTNIVRAVVEDTTGKIWIGTEVGLNYLENGKICEFNPKNRGISTIKSALITKSGELWIGYQYGIIEKIDYTKQLKINYFINLKKENLIWILYEDFENNIFVGTENGLYKYTEKPFLYYNESSNVDDGNITAICRLSTSELLIGSNVNGLSYYETRSDYSIKKIRNINKRSDILLPSNNIRTIFEDREKKIWIGTKNGIVKINNGEIYYYTRENTNIAKNRIFVVPGIPNKTINAINQDSEGKIWFGTSKGVCYFDGKEFTDLGMVIHEIKNYEIWYVFEDHNSDIWFATDKGAIQYHNDKLIKFTSANGFIDGKVKTIQQDKFGRLWFATGQGIFYYENGVFTNITKKDGLSSDNIYFIDILDNNLWIGSNIGIDKLDIEETFNDTSYSIKNYGADEGFYGIECNINSFANDTAGRIWVGTVNGLALYIPERDKISDTKLKTIIKGIKIKNEEIDLSGYSAGIDSTTFLPINLALPHNKNHITFEYYAPNFALPDRVRYKFRLIGFDTDWFPETKDNKAVYTNLPAGNYEFAVKAINKDGIENDIPTTFKFTINPPFWKTWWFITLCVVTLIILIYLYIRRREASLRKEKEILEEKVRIRTKQIQQQKDEIEKQAIELEKLSIVASETENSVIIAGPDLKIEWVNDGFVRMTGYTFEEYKKEKGTGFIETSSNPQLPEMINECVEHRKSVVYVTQTEKKTGEELWIQTTLTPVLNDDGTIRKFVAIDSDITKIKKAEEEISFLYDLSVQKQKEIALQMLKNIL